jgi:alkylated DNA repair protein (DNA oxidative demethylase)
MNAPSGPARDLFPPEESPPRLPDGVVFRPRLFDAAAQATFVAALAAIVQAAPLTRARTRSGGIYSAAMTNCGAVGWWSDEKGYRYTPVCPWTGRPWPAMPADLRAAATLAVAGTPWTGFDPDACLINFYAPGAKMGLHQDKDERDFTQPIVTVSLGDSADFLVGGARRGDKTVPVVVNSGDALILGGPARLLFHGIRKIYPGTSPLPGVHGRFSLTFRRAL